MGNSVKANVPTEEIAKSVLANLYAVMASPGLNEPYESQCINIVQNALEKAYLQGKAA